MFEHMMFKGNERLTAEMFDNLTENIGGQNNAYTADDVTVYHEVVPSNYLKPILWAEAERMSALTLNDQNFASERDVVKEEYRQRILANPYGEFFLDIDRKSFVAHPYKRPGIGNIAELDASKLPEMRAFHATFYRPDNATLIVVGDFKQEELDGWIKKYFGAVIKPAEKIPRVTAKEPPWKTDRIETTVQRQGSAAGNRHHLSCAVSAEQGCPGPLRGGGNFGGWRIFPALPGLVYEQQVAQDISCSADLQEDLGLLVFRVVLASGKPVEAPRKSLTNQIENVIKKGVTEAELDKAKSRFLTGKLMERETANGKASALGEAAVIYGDASRVNTDLAKVQAVTTAQIKEVLNKYITGKKKVVIEYLPESMKAASKEKTEKKSEKKS